MSERVRTRFAPSPTGYLHIGGLRTALYAELLARHNGGDFLLRIEDTDRARLVPGSVENICTSLRTCGVIPDEGVWLNEKNEIIQRGEHGPYVQSERRETHFGYAKRLIEMDKAYYCFCTSERLEKLRETQQLAHQPTLYDGLCRAVPLAQAEKRIADGEAHVIRLKLPKQGKAMFEDVIRGQIEVDWNLVDDQVVIKSDGFPTYHLAATCDDHDMEISHVIRGEEWISSTPKHLFIYDAFGWVAPKFAHLPLLLNPDRSKLSKRQGDVATQDYLDKGFLPDALVNFVALLGWNPTADREIYTHQELVEKFDLNKVNKAGAVFNLEKLVWMNQQYLKSMAKEAYLDLTHPFIADTTNDHQMADRALLLVRDRVSFPQDVVELTEQYFRGEFDFTKVHLTWKTQPSKQAIERLSAVRELIAGLDESLFAKDIAPMELETRVKHLISEKGWGNGDTLWPLRVALSGAEKSPTPFELLWVYGKELSLRRLDAAISFLQAK